MEAKISFMIDVLPFWGCDLTESPSAERAGPVLTQSASG